MLGIASSPTVALTPRDEGESLWGPLEQNILDSIGAFGSSLWDSVRGNDFSLPPPKEGPSGSSHSSEYEKTPQEINSAQKEQYHTLNLSGKHSRGGARSAMTVPLSELRK